MKLFNLLRSKKSSSTTTFNNSCGNVVAPRRTSLIDSLINNEYYNLASYQALRYYSICDTLFDGVDRIATKAGEINMLVYDKSDTAFINDHPIYSLFQTPNLYVTSYNEFIEACIVFYIVTGNSYYVINSMTENSEPQAIENVHPQNVNPIIGSDDRVDYYIVNYGDGAIEYKRKIVNGKLKYSAKLRTGVYSELFNIKKFNPRSSGFNAVGFSQLTPIYYRLEQCLSIAKHNLSLLKRGTTLGGIFMSQEPLSDENLERFRAMVNEYYSGEANAGKPIVIDNAEGWTYENSGTNTVDMDFNELDENLTKAIYNNLKIPLPKTTTESMTMANMDASALAMYDDAILPILNVILNNFTVNILSRYEGSEDLELSYDKRTIPALESRNIDNMSRLKEMNVLTDNEIREELNYPELKDGADDLYQPSSNVPYAR